MDANAHSMKTSRSNWCSKCSASFPFDFLDAQYSSFMDSFAYLMRARWVGGVVDDAANCLGDYQTTLFSKMQEQRLAKKKKHSLDIRSRVKVRRVKDKGIYYIKRKKRPMRMMTFIILREWGHRSTMFLLGCEGISLGDAEFVFNYY